MDSALRDNGLGSPPRMREEYECSFRTRRTKRITPAHAGRILLSLHFRWLSWDHPRACGKNLVVIVLSWLYGGSPPRMREEFLGDNVNTVINGDHPRACGKNTGWTVTG